MRSGDEATTKARNIPCYVRSAPYCSLPNKTFLNTLLAAAQRHARLNWTKRLHVGKLATLELLSLTIFPRKRCYWTGERKNGNLAFLSILAYSDFSFPFLSLSIKAERLLFCLLPNQPSLSSLHTGSLLSCSDPFSWAKGFLFLVLLFCSKPD